MRKELLLDCVKKNLMTSRDSGLAQKAYDDCMSRFTIFHVLNYIMYTESLNAFILMEERGLMRQEVKRLRKRCESEWDRYQRGMRRDMTDDAWYLLQDYCMAAHNDVMDKCDMLAICFQNYLLKKKCKNSDSISRLGVALKVGCIIEVLWDKYFRTYKNVCGLDFSPNFHYADMRVFIHYANGICNELSKGNVKVDFSDDIASSNAMSVLGIRLSDEDFLDKAAMQALEYSERYRPLYEKVKKDNIDEQKNKQIELLASKFDKVTKIKEKK